MKTKTSKIWPEQVRKMRMEKPVTDRSIRTCLVVTFIVSMILSVFMKTAIPIFFFFGVACVCLYLEGIEVGGVEEGGLNGLPFTDPTPEGLPIWCWWVVGLTVLSVFMIIIYFVWM